MTKDTLQQIAQVIGTNAAAWTVAFTHINTLLTTLSLTMACLYTIYKWVKDLKNGKLEN